MFVRLTVTVYGYARNNVLIIIGTVQIYFNLIVLQPQETNVIMPIKMACYKIFSYGLNGHGDERLHGHIQREKERLLINGTGTEGCNDASREREKEREREREREREKERERERERERETEIERERKRVLITKGGIYVTKTDCQKISPLLVAFVYKSYLTL